VCLYCRWYGPLHTYRHEQLELTYSWIYFVVSVVIPLVVLVFTGCRLMCSLRRGGRLEGTETDAANAVDLGRCQDIDRSFTLTLVAVALMHILLVSPAELANFTRGHLLRPDHTEQTDVYNLLVSVFNTLQAVNYSFNFLLYCAVNAAFRRRLVQLVSCRGQSDAQSRLRLQVLARTGLLIEASSSIDSNGRRSQVGRRPTTPVRGFNYHLAMSDGNE